MILSYGLGLNHNRFEHPVGLRVLFLCGYLNFSGNNGII